MKKNWENESLRRDFEYKMAVARMYASEPAIFFPHTVDFRGRAYPMHPHLNHLGGDISRGLLLFATGRKLGPHGLRWLKVSALGPSLMCFFYVFTCSQRAARLALVGICFTACRAWAAGGWGTW